MEANIEEALKAKEVAEKRFAEKDFVSARNYAMKAKSLYPELEGISQMVSTFEVYTASMVNSNGEVDYYAVLGLKYPADRDVVKKQYRKMAVMLHPDKNKTVGADGAFKLLSDAWAKLSRILKRNKQSPSTKFSTMHVTHVTGYANFSNPPTSHGLDSFWTVCTSCKIQYEYLRKYVNKKLKCKNCRGTFIAVETGAAPVDGTYPYYSWSCAPGIGYGNNGYDGVSYAPTTTNWYTGNGVSGSHTGHGYEYASNVSFQWGPSSGASTAVIGSNGSYAASTPVYQPNRNVNGVRANGKRARKIAMGNVNSNIYPSYSEAPSLMYNGLEKKRKVAVGASFCNGHEEKGTSSASHLPLANSTLNFEQNSSATETPTRRVSCAPAFDARKLLIDKAKNDIRKKLVEMRLASTAAAALKEKQRLEASKHVDPKASARQQKPNKAGPITITVPDPDFHDFDKDRSEECFKPKQIWAVYDEDDGMPRLYCIIREVVSVNPFQIHITYLNSKTDTEFGSVNWIDRGFTKSCGHFRAWHSDSIEHVNIFSHILKGEKAGRGGCVRIYPKKGEIWAVYRNWSPDWNRSTPDELRHQYEMVEVLDNYTENIGVCVTPLVKLVGFKTVYQSSTKKEDMRWIPRGEMFRFSHQVPSWSLEGESRSDLPGKCWDLDPAATPDELLHSVEETKA